MSTETLRRFLSRVQATPTVHFMSKRDSFLREPGYAYLDVALENSLSKNSMVVPLPATLELRRLAPCSRNTTIGLGCPRMWSILSKGAQLVKWPRAALTARFVLPTACALSPFGRCELGLHYGAAKDSKKQGLHHGGGG